LAIIGEPDPGAEGVRHKQDRRVIRGGLGASRVCHKVGGGVGTGCGPTRDGGEGWGPGYLKTTLTECRGA
jgi:hypothetical protein